ncbi:MAG: hypothetical protein H6835_15400 [Planctomycetes bacterium]|nr:hypothetical protein [Planctomycetota bacterium]
MIRFATCIAAAALLAPSVTCQAHLGEPVRLTSDGQVIDVTTGHAAPYLFDWDGDGLQDLLVGEFGTGAFDRELLPPAIAKGKLEFAQGKLRIYRNVGTASEPRYGGFEYLQADGGDASIPTT